MDKQPMESIQTPVLTLEEALSEIHIPPLTLMGDNPSVMSPNIGQPSLPPINASSRTGLHRRGYTINGFSGMESDHPMQMAQSASRHRRGVSHGQISFNIIPELQMLAHQSPGMTPLSALENLVLSSPSLDISIATPPSNVNATPIGLGQLEPLNHKMSDQMQQAQQALEWHQMQQAAAASFGQFYDPNSMLNSLHMNPVHINVANSTNMVDPYQSFNLDVPATMDTLSSMNTIHPDNFHPINVESMQTFTPVHSVNTPLQPLDINTISAMTAMDSFASLNNASPYDTSGQFSQISSSVPNSAVMSPILSEMIVSEENLQQEIYCCKWKGCDSTFNDPNELINHVNNTHILSGQSQYFCEWMDCPRFGIAFPKKHKLINHLRTHTGERPFHCPIAGCGKAFSRFDGLQTHIKTHSSVRSYQCKYCEKGYFHVSSLRKHEKTHE